MDEEPDQFFDVGVALGGSQAGHWDQAVAVCRDLLRKVLSLHERRSSIGIAQGEAILNSAQCSQLLIRYCVEHKLLHLSRATPPCRLQGRVQAMDEELHSAVCRLIG
eukprot:9122927-Karenia_brevis.AAC.1